MSLRLRAAWPLCSGSQSRGGKRPGGGTPAGPSRVIGWRPRRSPRCHVTAAPGVSAGGAFLPCGWVPAGAPRVLAGGVPPPRGGWVMGGEGDSPLKGRPARSPPAPPGPLSPATAEDAGPAPRGEKRGGDAGRGKERRPPPRGRRRLHGRPGLGPGRGGRKPAPTGLRRGYSLGRRRRGRVSEPR